MDEKLIYKIIRHLNAKAEEYKELSDAELVNAIGMVLADLAGEVEVAKLGAQWVNNVFANKSISFATTIGELVEKMAEVVKTHSEMSQVTSKLTSIALDKMEDTEKGMTFIEDIEFAKSNKLIETLRKELASGYGVLLEDSIKAPKRMQNGGLSANAQFLGGMLFGIPEEESTEFTIRTLSPSASSNLTLAEKVEFAMPTELLLLGLSESELNTKLNSIKEDKAHIELLKDWKEIDLANDLEGVKKARLAEIIELQNKLGYEVLSLIVEERPEQITNPATKKEETIFATNIQGLFSKKGDAVVIGDEAFDEIKVMGWRFNEYEEDSALDDKQGLDVRTLIEGNGWSLKRTSMEESLNKLKDFANLNWEKYAEHMTSNKK